MKQRILCLFIVFTFTITTAQPFVSVNAAELWNSPSGKKKSDKKTYYNKRTSGNNSGNTLYNRKSQKKNNKNYSSTGSLKHHMNTYKSMDKSRETKPSRLWSLMSSSAVQNRQNDLDLALQQEYNSRKRVLSSLMRGLKTQESDRIAGKIKHQKILAELREKRRAEKEERAARKYRALHGSKNRSNTKQVYKSKPKERSTGLKKPKKLFNDRNN